MRAATRLRIWTVCAALLTAVWWQAGCGTYYDDYYYDSDRPVTRYLTLYLQVADQDAEPLPDCTIWLNGEAQPDKTADTLTNLHGDPSEWRGWQYNWVQREYLVRIPGYRDAEVVTVWVTRTGWENAQTDFVISRYDRTTVHGRATFVMVPALAPQAELDPAQGRRVDSERLPAAPAP